MIAKQKYFTFCQTQPSMPISVQGWWLDCVCGPNNWNVLLFEQNGQVEAALPYYNPICHTILMPIYAQSMGIWFSQQFTEKNYAKELLRKQRICSYFVEQLTSFGTYQQHFHHSFTDWLPFYWNGYKQTTRYTYILENIGDEAELWANIRENIRRDINKAQTKFNITVKRGIPTEAFLKVNEMTYERQGIKAYSPHILKKLIEECRSRSHGDTWGAYDEQGELQAVVFIAWHNECSYLIAGGSNPSQRHTGAYCAAMWEAVRFASTVASSFNFWGSMLQGVEHFNKGFGAKQVPYMSISKGEMNLYKRIKLKLRTRRNL